tara:strand:+ start:2593 stop:3051 length:459 start_codon:yes stop_codon:yes gene_type:complete
MLKQEFLSAIVEGLEKDGIQKTVVGAIVVNDESKVLLMRRVSDDFMGGLVELPSGTVDAGENIPDALVREVAEETGLTITEITNYTGSFDYKSGSGKNTRQLNFTVKVKAGDVTLAPEEHDEFYWVSTSEELFNELNISKETKKSILNALAK